MSIMSNESMEQELHLYKGSYTYLRHGNMYSEESFDVHKDRKEHTVIFRSELFSRVATGELLTVRVKYTVDKDYIPTSVIIKRLLGEDTVKEEFYFDSKDNKINYIFTNVDGEASDVQLTTPPRFHIATPCAACSMLFLRSKKFDATGKNIYQYWSSKNLWKFESEPESHTLAVQRLNNTTENLTVEGQNLQATEYKVYENVNEEDKSNDAAATPFLRVSLSKHMSIPYIIKDPDGTKVQVKNLENLE